MGVDVCGELTGNHGFLLLLIPLALPLLIFLVLRRISTYVSQLPSGPHVWNLVADRILTKGGNTMSFTALAINLPKAYGPILSLRFGWNLIVMISSPELAADVLKTRDSIFSGRSLPSLYYKLKLIFRSSILGSKKCNENWKRLRALCHNWLLSVKAIELRKGIIEKKMMEMVEYLRLKEGESVRLREIVFTTLVNSMSVQMVSANLIDLERERSSNVRNLVMGLAQDVIHVLETSTWTDVFPFLDGLDFWENGKANRLYRKIKSLWEDVIKERRGSHHSCLVVPNYQDLLDVLIANGFSDDEICILLTELLIAGTTTTSIVMEWLMVELMKNETIFTKLRKEIAPNADGDLMKAASSSHMPYFQSCLKETFRLHPPGSFVVPHRALETCTMKNYTIPKNSTILINLWAIARDPSIWDDPFSFNPERFLESKLNFYGNHFELIPFGAGRRISPGINMSSKHIQYMVSYLVHYFDWGLPDGINRNELGMSEKFGMTVGMEKSLSMIFRRRM